MLELGQQKKETKDKNIKDGLQGQPKNRILCQRIRRGVPPRERPQHLVGRKRQQVRHQISKGKERHKQHQVTQLPDLAWQKRRRGRL